MKQFGDRDADQDDANLVASVLAGEREAFDILLQRYSSSVLHLCTRLLGNPFEAQDIAQEAALQAFLGLSRLREPAHFAAWFHAIAANLARMALRHRRDPHLHTLSDEDMIQKFWIDSPPTPEEYQMEREIQESILLALRNLSLVNRQAVNRKPDWGTGRYFCCGTPCARPCHRLPYTGGHLGRAAYGRHSPARSTRDSMAPGAAFNLGKDHAAVTGVA